MDKNRRVFGRFGTALNAYYKINGNKGGERHDCIVTNMSRKGFCIQIKADKSIKQNAVISLEVYVPEKKNPAIVKVIVKWVEKRGEIWAAGVEALEVMNELDFSKLG